MFNFTTQTIINDPNRIIVDANHLRIDNFILSKTNPVEIDVEGKLPSEEILASVTFNLSSLESQFVEGGPTKLSARVALYIGLAQTSADSFYANDLVYKGKPLYVEFPYTKGQGAAAATKLKKIADQVFSSDDGPILNVSVDGSNVKFEAVNGYQIIKEAALQVYDDSVFAIDCCSSEGGFTNVVEAVPVFADHLYKLNTAENELVKNTAANYTDADGNEVPEGTPMIYPGAEAFADYSWIMHNLRIPTCANTNYWSLTKKAGDLPIPNGKYKQYTIKLFTKRDSIGGGVVGEQSVSKTTHVFYILNTIDTTALNEFLGDDLKSSADEYLAKN